MIDYLKKYLFARKVCKKYGLKLTVYLDNCSNAKYHYNGRIELSLFNVYFYANFLHELAHHFDNSMSNTYCSESYHNRCVRGIHWGKLAGHRNRLYMEARANRYAIRMLKKLKLYQDDDYAWLKWCLTTYMWSLPVEGKDNLQNKLQRANIDYNINKYLLY